MNQLRLFGGTATISSCDRYRYRLERVCGHGKTFAYFGVNPSTADASIDDQTVMKWTGFTKRNGGGRFIVGNAFAYRATDVTTLGVVADPTGPDNDQHLEQIISEADILVPCWGSAEKVPSHLRFRFDGLLRKLFDSGKPVLCFGKTKSGSPKHPLMLSYDTRLEQLQEQT